AVHLRTGNIHENATTNTFLGHTASRSLPRRILTGLAAGDGLKGRGALVTGPVNDVEQGSIRIGRAQQVVVSTDVMHGRWREGHPPLPSPTEEPCMQTTIVQGHRITPLRFRSYRETVLYMTRKQIYTYPLMVSSI